MSDSSVNVFEYLLANASDFALCWVNKAACGLVFEVGKTHRRFLPFHHRKTTNRLHFFNFAKQYTNIPDRDIDSIMHSRKSLLFNNDKAWIKKDNSSFDVTMGSYEGAEVCELVGLFILNDLCNIYAKENIGLYRDDGLAVFKNITGPQADRIRKDI